MTGVQTCALPISAQFNDVRGLELGLDLASRWGPVTPGNPPQLPPSGYDFDTDPTLGWALEATDAPRGDFGGRIRLLHANPVAFPSRIALFLPEPSEVRITVFDVAGRRVRELWNGPRGAGEQFLSWDGRNQEGGRVATGLYLLVARAAGGRATSKFVVAR